jgi:hypothetical protein
MNTWIKFILPFMIVAFLICGSLIVKNLKDSNRTKESKEITVPQDIKTIDCTSISGLRVTFNIDSVMIDGQPSRVRYYAQDQNGLLFVIDGDNFGQWKCDYDLQ